MKKILAALVLILSFSFVFSIEAADEKPFVAVFNNPGRQDDFLHERVDLLYTASNWNDFDKFIQLVKSQAKNRDIQIDISCHGSKEDGNLYLDYDAFGYNYTYQCSMGHVLNEITKNLPRCKKVWVEACYSELCVEKTLVVPIEFHTKDGHISESYKYKTIPYPVYGVGPTPNFNNLIYLQDKYNIHFFFMDLRDTLFNGKTALADDTQTKQLAVLWAILSTYGI